MIDDTLNRADIVLLLFSADFIASDYCYESEMIRVMQRQAQRQATVVPILLRSCDWRSVPFGKLSCLPQNGQPVTVWHNKDQAWHDVEEGIKQVAESMQR